MEHARQVALSVSVLAADGNISPAEKAVAADLGGNLSHHFDSEHFLEACDYSNELASAVDLGALLGEHPDNFKKALVLCLKAVAQADGGIGDLELERVNDVAIGMGFDMSSLQE